MPDVEVDEYSVSINWPAQGEKAWESASAEYLAAVANEFTDIKRVPGLDAMFLRDPERQTWVSITNGMVHHTNLAPDFRDLSELGLELEDFCRTVFSCFGLSWAKIRLNAKLLLGSHATSGLAAVVTSAVDPDALTRRVKDQLGAELRIALTFDWERFNLRIVPEANAHQRIYCGASVEEGEPCWLRETWDDVLGAVDKLLALH